MRIIKKLISVVLSITVTLSLFMMNSNALSTGNLGVNETNITWSFDENTGILSISGSGRMKNLASSNGFGGKARFIEQVIITGDIENIGSNMFGVCFSLVSVSLPKSIKEIGESAFLNCEELKNIYYEGTKAQWDEITVYNGNDYLLNAKINYTEESHVCTFGEWKITSEPTCVADGFKIRKCECGNEEKVTIPATGLHKFEWTTTIEPQCLTDGEEKQYCKTCNLTGETRKLDKTGHKPGEWSEINKPSCTDNGLRVIQCEECGVALEEEDIAPTGHSFGEWKTVTKETEERNGEEKRICKTCKYVEIRVVDNIKTLIGDVNGDSKITAVDARIILQIVAGLTSADTVELKIADVNEDKIITAVDARHILQIVAGLK